jgi:hypothetical protein
VILHNPLASPWHFFGLEVVVIACAALGFSHAWRSWSSRDSRDALPLFTWAAIFTYGVAMEIVSYNTVDNFWHGQFTVMLYQGKLPLYVTAVYPALLYTGIACVRRLGMSRAAEPLACGLAIMLLDMPFDMLGPGAGWWSWSATDANIAQRITGVPVTSYYWHVSFGACMALLTRSADTWLSKDRAPRAWKLAAAPLAGFLTIVLGVIAFVPFHVLRRAGISDATNLAILVGAAAVILAVARKAPARNADPRMLATAIAWHAFFLIAMLAMGTSGMKALVIAAATATSLGVQAFAHVRATAVVPSSA